MFDPLLVIIRLNYLDISLKYINALLFLKSKLLKYLEQFKTQNTKFYLKNSYI